MDGGSANDEQKQRILDAAMEVFSKKGYTKASVRQIAAEAGVTTGALYYYYEDKDDLLADVLKHAVHYVNDLSVLSEDGRAKQPDVLLNEVKQATTKRLTDTDGQRLNLLLASEIVTAGGGNLQKHRQVYEDSIRKTADLFAPVLDCPDSESKDVLASILVAAIDGMAIQTSLGLHAEDMERLQQVFNDFFASGIKTYLDQHPDA